MRSTIGIKVCEEASIMILVYTLTPRFNSPKQVSASCPSINSIHRRNLGILRSPPDTLYGMHKIIEIFADRAALHTEILALRQQELS